VSIPSVPESVLPPSVVLPASTPSAPWKTRVDAVLWVHRAAASAASHIPFRGPFVPVTVAAFVRYLDSPVGPYSEIFASPVLLRRWPVPPLHIPFIAVDSVPSVHGGRTHWALPKTLATFDWSSSGVAAAGDGWQVSASSAPRGPAFPLVGGLRVTQPVEPGTSSAWVRMRGRARLGRVTVSSSGPTLPSWLTAGRHQALFISGGHMTITAPH
jgi:hypothetical protein